VPYYSYMHEIDGARLRQAAMLGGESARDAFRKLWEALYRRLSVFAASYRGLPEAERHDAVADALITVFGALASYDPGRPLLPWAYRIAANCFSDRVRLAGRESAVSLGPGEGGRRVGESAGRGVSLDIPAGGDHVEEMLLLDLAGRCKDAIAVLPEMDRRIAMLRFYEHMSAAEIGRVLGKAAGTVRWRISVIREGIRRVVGEDPA
jgi:RNA polymerase sigma factor (sigma-70 family)